MIIDLFKVSPRKLVEDIELEECLCHLGAPPCSWCMGLTEEEIAIFDEGGVNAVLSHRRGGDQDGCE